VLGAWTPALLAPVAALVVSGALWLRSARGPRRMRMRMRPILSWSDRPFLGWSAGGSSFLAGTREDSVAVVGPPRVGKTAGLLIPQALLWAGPLVSTSVKPDVLRASAARRLELAAGFGGSIEVYAPTASEPVEGLQPLRWSPLDGCQDPTVCQLRVLSMVGAAGGGRGTEDSDHWRAGAASVLRGYFHAAALSEQGMPAVLDWLAHQELAEPVLVLRRSRSAAGGLWALELEALASIGDRERGSFYSTARNSLNALASPVVLASCSANDLDLDLFLRSRSSLYVVSPTSHQSAVAPLVAGLIEAIVERAYHLSARGRLPAPLLLSLDEVANVAPLPSLGGILSQGAGQGVVVSWAVQSLAQLRARYGEDLAQACWSASRARIVFGGLADARDLEDLSTLTGEQEVRQVSTTSGQLGGQRTVTATWRPRLPASQLRSMRPGWAHLMYHSQPPTAVRVPVAASVRPFNRCPPWRPPAPTVMPHDIEERPEEERRGQA
ncbi:MAG: type IV secretory system conjugative DNA transfer family protein, partial [Candidatus Dormibacteraeota bacterium]|nr:type IV secretory system conjugative DNA transfer family protein [Candidatus Dormibacteraeota bacterium]